MLSVLCFVILILLLPFWWLFIPAFIAGSFAYWTIRQQQRKIPVNLRARARKLTTQLNATADDNRYTCWSTLSVPPQTREAVAQARSGSSDQELTIGHIDQDGRLWGIYGTLPGLESISASSFHKRKKYKIDVVLDGEIVLIRKDFQGNDNEFLREWYSLALLSDKAQVPALYKVDENRHLIYMSYIPGLTMRDILAQSGVKIRDEQTKKDPSLRNLSQSAREKAVRTRAAKQVPHFFSEEFLQALEQQIEIIHAHGIVNLDIKVGNVIVAEDQKPKLIDFENTQIFDSDKSLAYELKRDNDRARFNNTFRRTLMTDAIARKLLAQEMARKPSWYAPIDFGYGLTVGRFWSTDTGAGRWEYFNRKVMEPYIRGRRVLDLGSNNGIMPLLMLRSGAMQVVGLELDLVNVERAKLVHKIFEWRDQQHYQFSIHNRNILDILDWDPGHFEIVTSLCSLYYLSSADMARVVQKAAQMVPLMIIQANTDSDQEPLKRKKASIAFLKDLLLRAGFDDVQIFTPPGFSRPILIGQTSSKNRN